MTMKLRKATASQEILIGPMISSTDGITAQTGLSIANTDIIIWKTGGITVGAKTSGGATHISGGRYYAVLDDIDTNTAGSMIIEVNVAGALMWRGEFDVLVTDIYDTWFGTIIQPVDLVNIHGTALTETPTKLAGGFSKFFDIATPASTMELITAVTTCTTNTDMRGTDNAALATEMAKVPKSDSTVSFNATALGAIADAICDEPINTGHAVASSVGKLIYDNLNASIATVDTVVDTLSTELAKVPKSDAAVTWNATALASINAEVDTALNTAIPASNTATSVNDILLDVLTLAAINTEVDTALNTAIPASNTATSVNDILLDVLTLAAINAEVDTALNTAVPGSPVANSINERIVAIDTLTEASGSGDLAAILADTNELELDWKNGGRLDLILDAATAPSAASVADAVWDEILSSGHAVGNSAAVILSEVLVDTGTTLDGIVDDILTDTGTTLDTLIKDIPTVAEFEARSLPAADYVVVTDTLARVTLVDTCSVNSDMRGTNSAALASVCTETRLAELDATNLPADVDAILTDTGTTLPAEHAALDVLLDRVLGLNHENFRISSPVFVAGNMTSCTVKTYPTATDCTNDTNVLATYTVTATYDISGNLATYRSVKA